MRFQSSGKFTEGVADVDPVSAPATLKPEHILPLAEGSMGDTPDALWLALLGTASETVTLDLYTLIDETDRADSVARFIDANHRWFRFATGVVVTNGTIQKVTADIPAGGVVYARRTADAITASQTRVLAAAWV